MIWSLPDPYDPAVRDFARHLGCTRIQMVRVQPTVFAAELCCHANVEQQVSLIGGRAVRGYYFMSYDGGADYQAIHHSVWEDHLGDLIDLTPFSDGREIVLFGTLGRGARALPNAFFHSLAAYKNVTIEDYFNGNIMPYYVYVLVDPRTKHPFYVGKGTGNRARQHLWQISREHNPYKDNVIASIRRNGFEPNIVIIAENILDEQLAYDMEAKLIQLWGRKGYDKDGILTNVCLNNRPPNHRGKTYEEIYGLEEAEVQREKRRQLQLARGGYGPKKHSEGTRAKLRVTNGGVRNGRYGKPVSAETRKKIGEKNRGRTGKLNAKSACYIIISPTEEVKHLFGWSEVKQFCKDHDLSYGTFQSTLQKGWPPSRRGKNAGWTIRIKHS